MTTPSRLLAFCFLLAPFAACAGGENALTPSDDGGGGNDASVDAPGPSSSSSSSGSTSTSSSSGSVEVPPCGNGTLDSGEQCDDGNELPGDGCSPTCQLETSGPGDHCSNALPVQLTQTGSTLHATIEGSTAGAFNQYGSGCGGGSGADVAYTFTPSTSGKAVLTFEADFLGIISARSQCDDSLSEVGCIGIETLGETRTLEVPVFAGSPTTLFVDGFAGAEGNFTIDVAISLAACGNGVAELPERCDDGNAVDGDGCNATCELEVGGILSECPGQPFLLSGPAGVPRTVSVAGNTLTDGASNQIPLAGYLGSGSEVVYAFQPDVDGSARAVLNTGYRMSTLYARTECSSIDYHVAGAPNVGSGTSQIDLPVRAGEWFYLFVDAHSTQGGPYTATVTVTPAACGNGALDGNEACDDGNLVDGDGCSAACVVEDDPAANTCAGADLTLALQGDGHLRGQIAGTTQGKDSKVPGCGPLNDGAARDLVYRITPEIDGALKASLHDNYAGIVAIYDAAPCADAGAPAAVACSYAAMIPANFGNEPYRLIGLTGVKEAQAPVRAGQSYYVVVDSFATGAGSTPSTRPFASGAFTLKLDVSPAACGNGVLDGEEQCDDGNTLAGDTCSATCTNESASFRDTCATAEALVLTEGAPGEYAASVLASTRLAGGQNNFVAAECDAPGPDVYFKVVAPIGGILEARAATDKFDLILGLRDAECSINTRPLVCSNDGPASVAETTRLAVDAGEEIYVVVDSTGIPAFNGCTGASPSAFCLPFQDRGLFDLTVKITPSVCGDGFYVAGEEECDDGNLVDGDGCSSTCRAETLADVDRCPGHPLSLQLQENGRYRGVIAVKTTGLNADYAGFCGGNAPDGVVRIQSPVDGMARATATNMNNVTVYAREVCNDPNSEFRKTSGTLCLSSVVHETVSFPVVAGDDYYLFVDGLEGATGVPTLEVVVTGLAP